MVVRACNPSPWKAEAGRLQVRDQPGLHSEFQTSLELYIAYLKNKNKKQKNGSVKWLMPVIWATQEVKIERIMV
jgi:hypothetical protein